MKDDWCTTCMQYSTTHACCNDVCATCTLLVDTRVVPFSYAGFEKGKSGSPPLHVHNHQQECFEVQSGRYVMLRADFASCCPMHCICGCYCLEKSNSVIVSNKTKRWDHAHAAVTSTPRAIMHNANVMHCSIKFKSQCQVIMHHVTITLYCPLK